MRILVLSYEYPPIGGGGAKVVYGLTKNLERMGYEIDLVTMGYKNLPSFEKRNNLNIYRVKCLRLSATICTYPEMLTYLFMAFPLIIKLCSKNNYDINHTHFIFPDGILAFVTKIFTGVPYVLTAHGSDVPGYNPDRFNILHKYLLPVWKKITSGAEKIISPSKNLDGIIKRINPKLKTSIIPNGIRTNKFSAFVKKKKQILVVTRMFERKGVQYFLEAVKKLKHEYKINVVGDGPYLTTLKKISRENNLDINFLGYIDNDSWQLKSLYEESEIFVFTSSSENFPIVLLEAMLAGVAIITTNDSGCAEVVGDTALVVNPNDASAIRKSLITLMTDADLLKRFKMSAQERVHKFFSWDVVVQRYINEYNIILQIDNLPTEPVFAEEQ